MGVEVRFLKTTLCYMTRSCVNSSHITAGTCRCRDSSCPVEPHHVALRKPVGVDRQQSTEQTRSPATHASNGIPTSLGIQWDVGALRSTTISGTHTRNTRLPTATCRITMVKPRSPCFYDRGEPKS